MKQKALFTDSSELTYASDSAVALQTLERCRKLVENRTADRTVVIAV